MRILNVVNVPHDKASFLLPSIFLMQKQMHSKDFTFLLTAEPEQPPFLEKLARPLETFRFLREKLSAHGVAASILVQTTLGHDERGRPRSPAPYQRMIGAGGNVCEPVFCPLDSGFQRHIAAAMMAIAQAKPKFILIDDDFRLVHSEVMQGCFCPLHLDLLAEMFGDRLSRSGLLDAVATDRREGVQIRNRWESVERESLLRLARVIRDAVDDVDPGINVGYCGTPWTRLVNNDIARALAGRHRPFVRIASAVYQERDSKDFGERMDHMARQRRHLAADTEVFAESDTYPHSPYSVSGRKLFALLISSMINGLNGAKAWVVPIAWQGGENPQFIDAYRRLAPIAEALAPLVGELRWAGASMPIRDNETSRLPWSATTGKQFLQPAWTRIFGRMGLPYVPGGYQRRLRAFNGEAVRGYSVKEWEGFLAEGVLLDGGAARRLSDMGLAEHMGVRAETDSGLYLNMERYRDLPAWNGRASGASAGALRSQIDGVVRLHPQSPDTQILGDYMVQPWPDSGQHTPVSPAVTAYRNSLGGRVAVYAADLEAVPLLQHLITPARRAQLLNVLDWLCPDEYPIRVGTDTDLYVQVGCLPSGNVLLLFVLNIQPDVIPTIRVAAKTAIRSIDRLDEMGEWISVELPTTTCEGSRELKLNLAYLDHAVLLIELGAQLPISGRRTVVGTEGLPVGSS